METENNGLLDYMNNLNNNLSLSNEEEQTSTEVNSETTNTEQFEQTEQTEDNTNTNQYIQVQTVDEEQLFNRLDNMNNNLNTISLFTTFLFVLIVFEYISKFLHIRKGGQF